MKRQEQDNRQHRSGRIFEVKTIFFQMKTLQKFGAMAMLWLAFSSFFPAENQGKLVLEIGNIEKAKGKIWVGVYDKPEHYFVKEKAIVKAVSVSNTGKAALEINKLQYGTYAIAMFHDLNGNGKLDQNAFGVPTEPYAFSKLPKSKWRLPKFEEVKFNFNHNNQVVRTRLKRWWE